MKTWEILRDYRRRDRPPLRHQPGRLTDNTTGQPNHTPPSYE
ncbi:hypothetical protein FMEAI12_6150005 [Parafrankia sp. Ea1.12]|nr:hypothetical protein FMEAI12_6150005 [Parafrankia sp. Ea1.12]